jgi:hypothetical protein
MNDYRFRIGFKLGGAAGIGEKAHLREIALVSGVHYLLQGEPDKGIDSGGWLVLKGEAFADEEAARRAGMVAADALRWCCARHRMGIDVGQNKPRGGFTEYGEPGMRQLHGVPQEVPIMNAVHGLCVYQHPDTLFHAVSADGIAVTLIQHFSATFAEAVERGMDLPAGLRRAFDIYGASHFARVSASQHSAAVGAARFILLWTALETLANLSDEIGTRPDEEIQALIGLEHHLAKLDLSEDGRKSLQHSLRGMRVSTRALCGKLVSTFVAGKQYADMDACKFVLRCYDLRSQFVHGRSEDDLTAELASVVNGLDDLVADLLTEVALRTPQV